MILLHVISDNLDQVIEIADYLTKKKLILNPIIQEKVKGRKLSKNGKFETIDQFLLMGKTKSLLFTMIDKKLRKKYPKNMPVLYSLPIVYMDWKQADELIEETLKI
ncbi:MAG: hypothetical protein R3E32_10790 [Chitinophagales bacterium]